MNTNDVLVLDCRTCVAANTTACSDCVVQLLVANDAGPIEFVPTLVTDLLDDTERAASMFGAAGLLDDEPIWVPYDQFESVTSAHLV